MSRSLEKAFGWGMAILLGTCVYHAIRSDQPGAIGPPSPPTFAATAPASQSEDPPSSSTVDLHDIVVDFPGRTSARTSVESSRVGAMNVQWREMKRGEVFRAFARSMDPVVTPPSWNATASVDMAAEYAIAGLRSDTEIATVRTTKNERRYVAGMVGREVELRITPKSPREPHFTLRALYLSRTNRTYDVTVASIDGDARAEADAAEVMRSVRRGPNATVAAAPARPAAPLPPGVTPEDLAGIVNTMQNETAQVGTITPQPAPVADPSPYAGYDYGGYDYGGGGQPVPAYHGPVHVNGYVRKDGTYVQPHTRSAPRR